MPNSTNPRKMLYRVDLVYGETVEDVSYKVCKMDNGRSIYDTAMILVRTREDGERAAKMLATGAKCREIYKALGYDERGL